MHAAHSQSPAILCAFVQIRKKSFGDKIKVHRTKQKPFDQFVKVFVHLFTNTGSLIFRSPVEPVGFDESHPDGHAAYLFEALCLTGQNSFQ